MSNKKLSAIIVNNSRKILAAPIEIIEMDPITLKFTHDEPFFVIDLPDLDGLVEVDVNGEDYLDFSDLATNLTPKEIFMINEDRNYILQSVKFEDMHSAGTEIKVTEESLTIVVLPKEFEEFRSINAEPSASQPIQIQGDEETKIIVSVSEDFVITEDVSDFTGGTINVFLKGELQGGSKTGQFTVSSAASKSIIIPLVGKVSGISTSKDELTGLDHIITKGPSTSQSFTITGDELLENITLSTSGAFLISLDNVAFENTLTIDKDSKDLLIYVRMSSEQAGDKSNTIQIQSGLSKKDIDIKGTVLLPVIEIGPEFVDFFDIYGDQAVTQSTNVAITNFVEDSFTASITGDDFKLTSSEDKIDIELNNSELGDYTSTLTIKSEQAIDKVVELTGSRNGISLTDLVDFEQILTIPSQPQGISVSQNGMKGKFDVSMSDGFEVSETSSGSYSNKLTLDDVSVVNGFYVRMDRGATDSNREKSFSVSSAFSTGATYSNVYPINGTVITPSLQKGGNLDFSAFIGDDVNIQTCTITASNLASDINIVASEKYLISLEDSDYKSDLSITESGTFNVKLKEPGNVEDKTGSITLTTAGIPKQTINITGSVKQPAIVSEDDLSLSGTEGVEPVGISFSVTGTDLKSDLILASDENFLISDAIGGSYSNTLTFTGGDIFIKLKSGLLQNNYTGKLTIKTDNNVSKDVTINGVVRGIKTSVSALTGFTHVDGSAPSASKNFTVTSVGAGDILVTAPTGFLVASSDSGHAQTATLTSNGAIYVVMSSSGVGAKNGDITLTSTSIAGYSVKVSLGGSVSAIPTGIDG